MAMDTSSFLCLNFIREKENRYDNILWSVGDCCAYVLSGWAALFFKKFAFT